MVMPKLSRIILIMLFGGFLFIAIPAHAEYQLAWSDEFDGSSINSQNWEHQVFGGAGTGNNELQYYTDRPENSYVADGYLHIVALEEVYEGYNYTSARIHSAGIQDFLYGRMEARIKIPGGKG